MKRTRSVARGDEADAVAKVLGIPDLLACIVQHMSPDTLRRAACTCSAFASAASDQWPRLVGEFWPHAVPAIRSTTPGKRASLFRTIASLHPGLSVLPWPVPTGSAPPPPLLSARDLRISLCVLVGGEQRCCFGDIALPDGPHHPSTPHPAAKGEWRSWTGALGAVERVEVVARVHRRRRRDGENDGNNNNNNSNFDNGGDGGGDGGGVELLRQAQEVVFEAEGGALVVGIANSHTLHFDGHELGHAPHPGVALRVSLRLSTRVVRAREPCGLGEGEDAADQGRVSARSQATAAGPGGGGDAKGGQGTVLVHRVNWARIGLWNCDCVSRPVRCGGVDTVRVLERIVAAPSDAAPREEAYRRWAAQLLFFVELSHDDAVVACELGRVDHSACTVVPRCQPCASFLHLPLDAGAELANHALQDLSARVFVFDPSTDSLALLLGANASTVVLCGDGTAVVAFQSMPTPSLPAFEFETGGLLCPVCTPGVLHNLDLHVRLSLATSGKARLERFLLGLLVRQGNGEGELVRHSAEFYAALRRWIHHDSL